MIKRDILNKITPWLSEKKIIFVKGARQVGKTTLLYQLRKILKKHGNQVLYFSIDQELTNPIFTRPKLLIDFLNREYDIKEKNTYLMLDEFQYIKNAGIFLKVLFDITRDYLHIIVSGSSTLKLSEGREFLTGRKIEFNLSTFSFIEHLRAKSSYNYSYSWKLNNNLKELIDFYETYKDDLQNNFVDYINWGGYPEVVTHVKSYKRNIILKEIINTYIKKDVIDFLKVEKVKGFNDLVSILSSQIACLVNKHELSNTLNLHAVTLNKYLNILEGTFIFSFVKPFYTNIRKELSKMQKVYVNDTGIRKYFVGIEYNNYAVIGGNDIENFVYNNLREKFDDSIFFYRTISKSEIDFVIKQKRSFILAEAKFRNDIKLPHSIIGFKEKYKNIKQIFIITRDMLKKEKDVIFLPAVLVPFVNLDDLF